MTAREEMAMIRVLIAFCQVGTFCLTGTLTGCDGQGSAGGSGVGGSPCPWGAWQPEGTVVATAGAHSVTVEQLNRELGNLNPYKRARYANLERIEDFAIKAGEFQLLAQEACRQGLYKRPEVMHDLNKVMLRALLKIEAYQALKLGSINDKAVDALYESQKARYQRPEQRSFVQVLIARGSPGARQTADKVLAAARAKADVRNHFKLLVITHSQEQGSKERGGLSEYLDQEAMAARYGAAIAEAVFAPDKLGVVIDRVLESPAGFHVIKVHGIKGAINQPLHQVKVEIRQELVQKQRQEKMQRYIERLKGSLGWSFDEGKAKLITVDPLPRHHRTPGK